MQTDRTYFTYFDAIENAKGGKKFTVAYRVVNGSINFEVAACNERDQFCRRIGRAIAEGRLLKHGGVVLGPDTLTHKQIHNRLNRVVADLEHDMKAKAA